MDLAKIRQKARQEQEQCTREEGATLMNTLEPASAGEDVELQLLSSGETSSVQTLPVSELLASVSHQTDCSSRLIASRPHHRDPLDVILAGREAAGCDDNLPLVSGEHSQKDSDEYQEYLCFRVSDEIYGINIMDIKEIIKPREVTEVPRAPSFVSGIISLRGIIIPIIDMLDRLGLPREILTGRERVIVVRHGDVFSGLLVDEIIQVVNITNECMEAAPAVLEGIDRDFVNGIGRADGRMIIILNLETITDIHLY
jgi:purine-binding chemotaxis protein CheW